MHFIQFIEFHPFFCAHPAAETRERNATPHAETTARIPAGQPPAQIKTGPVGTPLHGKHRNYRGTPAASEFYSEIASTGHTPAQTPHEMHFSASMTYWVSPSEIASFGQLPAQEPQLMHASEIT